ncbi:MAG: hypothetical protein II737_05580 [Mailhella sp.]|nr:hypothetical protein [Mailhella sp.]
MFTLFLYCTAALLLAVSFRKDKAKTRKAVKKGLRSFENVLPLFLFILMLMGMLLAVFDRETISALIGSGSGASGLALSGLIGSITLIPAFAAYPLAGELLRSGAGYAQITMFITTLMMVGLATLPLEREIFGRTAYLRNGAGLVYSLVLSLIMGWIFA